MLTAGGGCHPNRWRLGGTKSLALCDGDVVPLCRQRPMPGGCARTGEAIVEHSQRYVRAGVGGVEAAIDEVARIPIGIRIGQRALRFLGRVVQINHRVDAIGGFTHVPEIGAQDIIGVRREVHDARVLANGSAAAHQRPGNHACIGLHHVRAGIRVNVGQASPSGGKWVRVRRRYGALELEVAVVNQLHVFGAGNDVGQLELGLRPGRIKRRPNQTGEQE